MRTDSNRTRHARVALILTGSLLIAAAPALAEPTAQLRGGSTRVELDPGFVGALDQLGVAPAPIRPGSLWRGKLRFPIPAGVVDLGTASGDVFHAGGLRLSAGPTQVDLLNFVIDTTGSPQLTGIVVVNGDVVGRLPLFDLELTQAPSVYRGAILRLSGVDVLLTDVAAQALNEVFGITDLTGGLPIGVASLLSPLSVIDGPGHDDDDDDDDRGASDRSFESKWR